MDIHVYCKVESSDSLLPNPVRCLIVGSSGSGKTNLLLNFIYNKNGIPFKHLYVFSRSIEQPAYTQLRKHYEKVERVIGSQIAYFYSNCNDLLPLDDCKNNSLAVFDDCVLDEQSKLKDYFIRGRHKHISCIYLSQNYSLVDMQVIRNNVNLLCIFKQNKHYTKRIYDDFVGSDMSFEQFETICNQCWSKPFGFISIDVNRKTNDGKFRCMLKDVITVK